MFRVTATDTAARWALAELSKVGEVRNLQWHPYSWWDEEERRSYPHLLFANVAKGWNHEIATSGRGDTRDEAARDLVRNVEYLARGVK